MFFNGFWVTQPSPLNDFQPPDHWFQWFFDGFGVLQPLASMVFNGKGPLVQRCDGFNVSFTSRGGDAIPDAPFVLVTAKCKMGVGKSATFRERRRARETNGKRRRHLSASKGPQVVAWISSLAYFCISQQQQTNGKRRRHLGASPCTSFLTVALLDFAR